MFLYITSQNTSNIPSLANVNTINGVGKVNVILLF